MAARRKGNDVGDVVLVHLDDKPAGYARLDAIRSHGRPGWYECDLLFLGQPPQPVTWILERAQIDGTPFTMGGRPVRIEGLPPLGELHPRRPGDEAGAREEAPRAKKSPARKRSGNVVRLVRKPGAE